MLDRCECAREVGVGEPTAHRLVASADGLARRGGHGAVEAVAVGVREGRFRWPALKKCGEKNGSGKQLFSFRRVLGPVNRIKLVVKKKKKLVVNR